MLAQHLRINLKIFWCDGSYKRTIILTQTDHIHQDSPHICHLYAHLPVLFMEFLAVLET